MAVTSGDFQYTKTTENKIDDFGNEKQVKVCIIDSYRIGRDKKYMQFEAKRYKSL